MNDIDALEPTPAQFSSLQADEANGPDLNLDVILDVPVTLSLEVGRARLPIRNLLQLNWSAAPANPWTCSSTAP